MGECINLNHDYVHAIKVSRAKIICPDCKEDITLQVRLLQQAGLFDKKK